MISLIIRPREEVARVNQMLANEYGTASNIKSRVTRLSVLAAITSTQQRLKLYNRGKPTPLPPSSDLFSMLFGASLVHPGLPLWLWGGLPCCVV